MTIPNAADAPVLRTDAEVLERVEQLIGSACHPRQLWIMWLDGDCRQAPVVMPIADIPRTPDRLLLRNLGGVIAGLRDDLATDRGPGSVILTVERRGGDGVMPGDRRWAEGLRSMCEEADVTLRGLFLSTDDGIRPLT